jgi:hypothetical protein
MQTTTRPAHKNLQTPLQEAKGTTQEAHMIIGILEATSSKLDKWIALLISGDQHIFRLQPTEVNVVLMAELHRQHQLLEEEDG